MMDDLNHGFGQLSTDAAEWKPSISSSQSKTTAADTATDDYIPEALLDSDLRAAAVKEFVPGKGWVVDEGEIYIPLVW